MVEPVFGRWGPTEVMERVLDGTWAEVVDGMGLIEPVSIAFSGTSAAITGLGSVEFSAVSSLSLNGVFSSDFDNYMIVIRHLHSATDIVELFWRLRLAGVDASGSNYTRQQLSANGTAVEGVRTSSATSTRLGSTSNLQRSGDVVYFYGPSLAQPTAMRALDVNGFTNATITDQAATHSVSTAYDGLTVFPNTGSISGRVAVYGMVK